MAPPYAAAQAVLAAHASAGLLSGPTPVQELSRLRRALGGGPRLLVKRDDLIPFGFGGNKVRKLDLLVAAARAAGADTLVTCGGVQSNHMRATAAAGAAFGMRVVLVANGTPPMTPTGNALLETLLGAEVTYVPSRDGRTPAMARLADQLRAGGRHPYVIPLGASIPLGALGLVRALGEVLDRDCYPDVIVHSTSSGGTQAGILAGCEIFDVPARVIGVSADEPADSLGRQVHSLLVGIGDLLGLDGAALAGARTITVDDQFVGGGYGIPTEASREAIELVARTEGIFLDPTYTGKAMAGLIASIRNGTVREDETVLFWHTGGVPALFA